MRRNSRDLAFKFIYESYFASSDNMIDFSLREDEYASYQKEEFSFALELYQTYNQNKQTIQDKIQAVLKDYELARLFKIDLALLCLAITEIDYFQTPLPVASNEMVELAKLYSTEKSPKFINGVISDIYGAKHE